MSPDRAQLLFRDRRWLRRPWVAALLSLAAVAIVSIAVWALQPVAPVLSLGVLYLFAVLPVAALWGLRFAIPVSIVSMLAFNWLFLPPTHTLRLEDSENWVALAVYVVTAISVSALSDRARRRAEEAVEAEALRRSDAVKTAVLRSVSHDLRSPITAITTASEVLRELGDTLPDEDRDELVEAILIQVHRLDRLVGNLLELSRLEAGGATPARELWPVDGLVSRALDAIAAGDDRIDVDVPHDIPPVEVDPAQIERALANVIENALKFSPADARVSLQASLADGSEVRMRVADAGPGLPADEREHVFEPFVRGATANGGSGLGLAIARGFVGLNGGRLWVEPGPNGGSEFVFAFPATAVPVDVTA